MLILKFTLRKTLTSAGVITLEDVLEEVIQDEIIDETDTFETNEHSVPVVRRPGRDRPDVSAYLALFEHKIRDQNRLSPSEVQAVSAFLLTAVPEFSIFASVDTVLKVGGSLCQGLGYTPCQVFRVYTLQLEKCWHMRTFASQPCGCPASLRPWTPCSK
jgi:hypothetical protein